MNLEDKNIDQLFKSHLEQTDIPFDEAAWGHAQLLLDKKRRAGFLVKGAMIVGMLAVLVSIGFYTFEIDSNLTTERIETLNQQLTKSNTSIIENSGIPTDSVVVYSSSDIDLASSKTKDVLASQVENKEDVPFIKNDPPIEKWNTLSPSIRSETPISSDAPASLTNILKVLNGTKLPDKQVIIDLVSEPYTESLLTNRPSEQIGNESYQFLILPKLSFLELNAMEYSLNTPNIQPQNSILVNKNRMRFFISSFGGMGWSNSDQPKLDIGELSQEHSEMTSLFYGLGLSAEYSNIGVSIQVQNHAYSASEIVQGFGQDQRVDTSYSIISKNRVINGESYWVVEESLDTTSIKNNDRLDLLNITSEFRYLQIPVHIYYRFPMTKRISLKASAGYRIGIPLRTNSKIWDITGSQVTDVTKDRLSSNSQFTAGLGVDVHLTTRILLGFSGQYIRQNTYLTSLDPEMSYNRVNIRFGICYAIRE
ncbi:MAG: hypothetical protein COA58_04335 [Bacteroidetes bacterium]|nr:MAG: hypothetical protein COA58_04335 [Bacteroidota bacterium]